MAHLADLPEPARRAFAELVGALLDAAPDDTAPKGRPQPGQTADTIGAPGREATGTPATRLQPSERQRAA